MARYVELFDVSLPDENCICERSEAFFFSIYSIQGSAGSCLYILMMSTLPFVFMWSGFWCRQQRKKTKYFQNSVKYSNILHKIFKYWVNIIWKTEEKDWAERPSKFHFLFDKVFRFKPRLVGKHVCWRRLSIKLYSLEKKDLSHWDTNKCVSRLLKEEILFPLRHRYHSHWIVEHK